MTRPFFFEDRLLALKYFFGEVPAETFNLRDDRQCAYRVVSDLIAQQRVSVEFDRDEKRKFLQILGDYRALTAGAAQATDLSPPLDAVCAAGEAADRDQVLNLIARCLSDIPKDWAAASELHRRSAQVHLQRAAELERLYRQLVAEAPPTFEAAQPVVDFDALGRCLSESGHGSDVVVRPLRVIHGGYSKITFLCSLAAAGKTPVDVILRSDAGLGFADTSVLDEFPILQAMSAAGVAAPPPIWAGRTSEAELPVMVVGHVAGEPFGSPFAALRRSEVLCREMGRHLAGIHQAPLDGLGTLRDLAVPTPQQIQALIHLSQGHLRRTGEPVPVVEFSFRWLLDNLNMSAGRRTALHGDYGPHNLLAEGERITAILDWEFAKVGNPAEDLCYARLGIEALGSWDMFVQAYVEAGGIRPSADELHYFTVFGLTRLCVMLIQADASLHGSKSKPIRMATPGAERLRPALLRLGSLLAL